MLDGGRFIGRAENLRIDEVLEDRLVLRGIALPPLASSGRQEELLERNSLVAEALVPNETERDLLSWSRVTYKDGSTVAYVPSEIQADQIVELLNSQPWVVGEFEQEETE